MTKIPVSSIGPSQAFWKIVKGFYKYCIVFKQDVCQLDALHNFKSLTKNMIFLILFNSKKTVKMSCFLSRDFDFIAIWILGDSNKMKGRRRKDKITKIVKQTSVNFMKTFY